MEKTVKASEIRVGKPDVVELCPSMDDDFGKVIHRGSEVRLWLDPQSEDLLLSDGEKSWPVKGANASSQRLIEELLQHNFARICSVVSARFVQQKTHTLVIEIFSFAEHYAEPGEVHFGISDSIIEQLDNLQMLPRTGDQGAAAVKCLEENTIIDAAVSFQPRLLISGPAVSDDLLERAFRIYGKEIIVDIERTDDGTWRVQRVHRFGTLATEHSIILVFGQFKYVDISAAAQVRSMPSGILDSLVEQASSYLNLWRQYNELERESNLDRARSLGELRYEMCKPLPSGAWQFAVQNNSNARAVLERLATGQDSELTASPERPEFLDNSDSTDDSPDFTAPDMRSYTFTGRCTRVNVERSLIVLSPLDPDTPHNPPAQGYLHAAIHGDEIRLQRRVEAYQRLQMRTGPMPQLLLLIENQAAPTADRRRREVNTDVVAKLVGGRATPQQIEAVRVALNTPDVALIQGPPGTGKTRVIAAIQTLLAEETGLGAGDILVTSYQHDAVDVAVSQTRVLGLPAVRMGRRQGKSVNDTDFTETWRLECIQYQESRLETLPMKPIRQAYRTIRDLAVAYNLNPGNASTAIDQLEQVYNQCYMYVSANLSDALLTLLQKLKTRRLPDIPRDERKELLTTIRQLRTEAISFADDGAKNARHLLQRLEQNPGMLNLNDEHKETLQSAATHFEEPSPSLLERLKLLQYDWIGKLIDDSPLERASLRNTDVELLLMRIVNELDTKSRQTYEGVDEVLYDYLHDLENDLDGVRDAVRTYSLVLAATCQQSVNKEIVQFKHADNDFRYRTVIVDEAARANPLDLLIPMARAERRIILVGDHRQLPHILEPDVERGLTDASSETREAFEKSLFERLFRQLTQEEKRSGVKRTVTLNKQFRMHPVLGNFVSSVFYEPHGEGFSSERPPSRFAHNIEPYIGKVAVWVDMPFHRDHGEKRGASKSRTSEARWAVGEARRILEAQPELSVGIITFYTAQVKAIQQVLKHQGLAQESEEGFELLDSWRNGVNGQGQPIERLRVGTVDAFQGKEFDVVILSLVRSNEDPAGTEQEKYRKYGFLRVENRLCVAMSRQKRLLIVVGDAEMVRHPSSEEAIPGLCAFYRLCGEEDGLQLQA